MDQILHQISSFHDSMADKKRCENSDDVPTVDSSQTASVGADDLGQMISYGAEEKEKTETTVLVQNRKVRKKWWWIG